MTRAFTSVGARRALVAALLVTSSHLHAQPAQKRLSDWLLEHGNQADSYPLGLMWNVPGEKAYQSVARLDLLRALSPTGADLGPDPDSKRRLHEWISTLPVTGRVPVALADARWLQANPDRDPILKSNEIVVLPRRPQTITVITASGGRCSAIHTPGAEALQYLKLCVPGDAARTDWAWVVQPDGRVQRFGIATWNRQQQDEPAPGAWIWAPPRDGRWPESLSQKLVTFLATQGPAPDPEPGSQDPLRMKPYRLEPSTISYERARSAEVSSSDWGGVGLLQTPTARMAKQGAFSFHFSRTTPFSRGNLFFQPFDWMEAGFRYVNIGNRLYGPPALSGSQSDKDKSIDVKFRLWRESAYVPELAVGLRDLAGTGKFSGEYLVANKRTGDFDWSLGMGWGDVGARGNLRNPLSLLSKSFDVRNGSTAQGGSLAFGSYFRGPAAMFGGVQYQTPWKPLLLKLEYDGNDYQHSGNNQRQDSPFNVGLLYRAAPYVDLSLGIERGNTIMFGVTLRTQLDGLETPKPNDPPRIPVSTARPQNKPDWSRTSRDIAAQTDWSVRSIEQLGNELRVTVDDPEAVYIRDRIDKATAVLNRDAPSDIDRLVLAYRQRGLAMSESVIDRDSWARQKTQALPPHEKRETIVSRPPESTPPDWERRSVLYEQNRKRFEAGLGFDYQQNLGGPDGFVLFQISAAERAKYHIRDDTWLQGTVRLGLVDNYNKFKYTAPSNLPRVRTFLREYVTTSKLTMPNLQATHVGKIGDNQFYSVYGGYLEEMFAGVGAEWLYKPSASRTAFGVDINAVRQRDFEQNLGLRDYRVATGHATLYWDTGWQDVQAKLSVGRYLAKDFGATLDMSRVFRNGVTIGAFATKTNVSAAQFGEGSFDKGIYLSIPFDAMLTRSTNSIGHFVWKPLTRDGGAMLARSNPLYGLTYTRNERTQWFEPAPRPNDAVIPSDRQEEWQPAEKGPDPSLHVIPRSTHADFAHGSREEMSLTEELYRQGFRNIKVSYDASHRMRLAASNGVLRPASRAIGRAARTSLRFAPLDVREIQIVLSEQANPLMSYTFSDLAKLDGYFNGTVSQSSLAGSVAVYYLDPSTREADPLALLGDIDTSPTPPKFSEAVPGIRSTGRVLSDLGAAARTARDVNWLQTGALGAGLVLASSVLDKRGLRFANDHANSTWLKQFNRLGNALPLIGAATVTLAALDGSDPRRSRTGFSSLEAAGTAYLVSTGMKYAFGRARPTAGLGSTNFKPFSGQDSFPSNHAILAWAVATPFALEYDSYWRYGAATIASLARVTRKDHWVSDVVAGSLLGYGIGRIFWESSRPENKNWPRAMIDPTGFKLAWELD